MKLEKALRIGIDWLSLYNFDIEYDKSVEFTTEITAEYKQERIRIEDPIFMIDSYERIYESGKVSRFKVLRFNPNKILFGHNIFNSREVELKESLDYLKKLLYGRGIRLNLENAKIREIEININFEKDFNEYQEALEIMFISSPNLKKISNYNGGQKHSSMFLDGTFQANWKTYKCIAYDKKREVENKELIKTNLTRIEWQMKSYIYCYYLEQLGLDSTLDCLIKNIEIIDYIFREHTKKKLVKNAYSYIDNSLKPNLERGYLRFKESSALGRKIGVKIERNVYNYLEKNYWIFDYTYLINIIEKYNTKNKKREKERVKNKYFHHNNLDKFNYLMEYIFPH